MLPYTARVETGSWNPRTKTATFAVYVRETGEKVKGGFLTRWQADEFVLQLVRNK